MISSVANWISCSTNAMDRWIFGEGEDESTSSSSNESYDENDESTSSSSSSDSEDGKRNSILEVSSNSNEDGLVYSWGYNYFGQCGNGGNQTIIVPSPVQFSIDIKISIKTIACGDSHTLAIAENPYGLYSWGCNRWGQLGLGDQINRNQPTRINHSDRATFVAIACGSQHSMIVSNFGELYTFGCGTTGRLGLGDESPRFKPTVVSSLVGKQIVSCGAGVMHSSCVDSTGKIYSFGWNRYGQLGTGSVKSHTLPAKMKETQITSKMHFVKVVCGKNHTLALSNNGEMVSFGFNACGQLGVGSHLDQINPTKIEFSEKVLDIATGYYHSLCVTDNGEAYSWGYMSDGGLGLSEVYTHQTKPKLIPLVHIRHTFSDSNDAFDEIYGKGDENTTEETIENHKKYIQDKYSTGDFVEKVGAGAWNSAIITSSGKLYTFGYGDTFRTGNHEENDQDIPIIIEQDKWGLERNFNIKEDLDIDLNEIIELEKEKRLLKQKKKQLKLEKQQLKENQDKNVIIENVEKDLSSLNINNSNNINTNNNNNNNDNNNNHSDNSNNSSPNIITNKININNIKVYSKVTNIAFGGAHSIAVVRNSLKK
ncbi:hypothetical protein DICPUDRAFT_159521 [Dictyostelium purpureum]|uniref:RCC1-like domain-containing protein n=1 Tax=Dictyostelium purpureum TaxID=5786 RepID=F1A4C0_DICPU|nr:uncharacterized protein DICPUDRAFT_159521 [Dictyostelium purpureum]EGC28958.1 hypothetical protein DICPUDRAFT_159521 [Dictyostelium purpureum]|eukprot:XP_003294517.1 hypothetical protein DICPUDRAFT_159521 [Dictyostelium purpureum]